MRPKQRRTTLAGSLLAIVLASATAIVGSAAPAGADGRATPGNFTGYGFDQCETVSQKTMDTWLRTSPFLAVGVYISGASRACRTQANLTPAWVDTQLRNGWRILPITLGPQSSCVGRFPRYGPTIDPTIKESSTNGYAAARDQGTLEAQRAVAAATKLGIAPNSTLWYDLEGWSPASDVSCRESALVLPAGLDQTAAQAGLRLRGLLQCRLGDGHPRQRPQEPADVRPARLHLDRPVGRRGEHLHHLHQ